MFNYCIGVMKKLFSIVCVILFSISSIFAAKQYKDSIVVATDGTGDYCSLSEAMEGIRAFMDYKVTVFIKKGVYKEKVIVPAWLQNVDFIGEGASTSGRVSWSVKLKKSEAVVYDDISYIYSVPDSWNPYY